VHGVVRDVAAVGALEKFGADLIPEVSSWS
jgi:hypothetical protein